MNKAIDYKKLAYQIGIILANILMIIGGIFTLVALIEMKKYGTTLDDYYYHLDNYDYNLLTMKTYGIAMMVSGFIAYLVNMVMNITANSQHSSAQNVKEKKTNEAISVCEVCGAKSNQLKTITIENNEKIRLCPQCYNDEKET